MAEPIDGAWHPPSAKPVRTLGGMRQSSSGRAATDPLLPLLELAGVADAADEARDAVDQLFGHRQLRRGSGPVSLEISLRSARASAALAGASYELEAVRSGALTDPTLQGALRVAGELGTLADRWAMAPRQVLARLHLLAARDLVDADELGRPVRDEEIAHRLDGVVTLITDQQVTAAPAVIVAAVVHGELLSLRPFPGASGVVARAAARLTLVRRGLDPKAVTAPEVGHVDREPEYVGAAATYATGTPDGVRAWLRHCCAAVTAGAREGLAVCEELTSASS